MKQILLIIALTGSAISFSQAPFQHKTKFRNMTQDEYVSRLNKTNKTVLNFDKINKANTVDVADRAVGDPQLKAATDNFNDEQIEQAESADVLKQFSGSLVVSDYVDKLFPTINGDIITYRLNLWTTNSGKARHYLPLSIISKVSGSSQNNTGTLNDAVSFFGAPLTFRFSPTFIDRSFTFNRLVIGMLHDVRVLAIGDTATNQIDAGFGYYGAFGFSYFGDGDVSSEPTTRYTGRWSFSTMLYLFTSGGKFNKTVFGNYEPKNLTGLEMLLRFKTDKDEGSKFNLLIGANYGFTRGAPNYNKWDFRIGVGN